MELTFGSSTATLVPTLITEFEQPADIGWYESAYLLPFAVLMPTMGKCYTLWKIKWLYLSSLLILIGKLKKIHGRS